ncbi:uncharacterized protein LOC123439910 [Hordeum vulgare subsp. vulgare]|uniref:uncharacterized protein LOC123439910 n=1 Tax=Hordeum vulgare subsp. vulgare TaxID=112509 RepID=UPI001D1A5369|nr:uncharacterized protein LOC123439910 [Hordeum vulgare subsp. vulgare]
MKLCEKNTECAKKQKNPHTTGRKSHARLRKEMEIKSNRQVSKIELWDEAHKQKDGKYKNAKTKIVMEKLEERKNDNNGRLSFSDYGEVFKSVHGEDAKKLRGYYGDKYWSEIKVSQGLTFVQHFENEGNVHLSLRALGDNVENVTDELAMVRSFLKRKFPGEDFRNEFVTMGSDEVDLDERVVGSDLPNESHNEIEVHARLSAMQFQELHPSNWARGKECYTGLSLPHEKMVAKKAHIENFNGANKGTAESNLRDNQITSQDLCPSFSARTKEDFTGLSLPHMVAKKAHIEKIDSVNQGYAKSTLPEKANQELHPSNCARTKEGCTSLSSPHKHTVTKKAHDAPEPKIGQAENSNADMQGALKRSELLHRVTKQVKKPKLTTRTHSPNKPPNTG